MKETKYFALHLFAGLVLFFILGFHFLYTHIGTMLYNVEDNISIERSQGRDSQMIFLVFFIFLLGFGLYHALFGLKNILHELTSSDGLKNFITAVIVIVGIFLFVFGSYFSVKAYKNQQMTASKVEVVNVK